MPPSDLEMSLDSLAIGAAAAMRDGGPQAIAPARLHAMAQEDAVVLLRQLRSQTLVAKSLTVALHLDEKALAAAIYRHAMLHAGAFLNVETNLPYDQCPRCGSELTWPDE